MLPRSGIVRSLPSGRQLASQSISRTLSRNLANGRQFGTSVRSTGGLTRTAARVGTGQHAAMPIVLGGVASARHLSLWGWGWGGKKTADAPETAAAAGTPPPAPVEAATAEAAPEVTAAHMDAVTAPAPSLADASSVTASDVDLSSIAQLDNPDVLNMPETLGFLHNIGLDYGWGPTSCMQWLLEHVHVYTGFGWGGSIIATAFLLRAVMLYPQMRSLRFSGVMTKVKEDPRSKEAMKLISQGWQTGDQEMMSKGRYLSKLVNEKYGANKLEMLWSFIQIPFSFGLFRIISGMAHIPVPSLETAGFLWFTDLTASDPYFILPAAGSALLFGSVLLNSKYAAADQKAMMKKLMYFMGTFGFFATTFLSAGVNLMMVTTGAGTLVTAAIFNNETIRRALRLPILPVHEIKYEPPRQTSPGLAGVRERLTHNLDDMKKGFNDQISNYTGQYAGTEEERAEKKRKEDLRKIEQLRQKLERDEWEKKFKSGR